MLSYSDITPWISIDLTDNMRDTPLCSHYPHRRLSEIVRVQIGFSMTALKFLPGVS